MDFKIILDTTLLIALIAFSITYIRSIQEYKRLVDIEVKAMEDEERNLEKYQQDYKKLVIRNAFVYKQIKNGNKINKEILDQLQIENNKRQTAINELSIPNNIRIDKEGSIYSDDGEIATRIFTRNEIYGIYLVMRDVWGDKE